MADRGILSRGESTAPRWNHRPGHCLGPGAVAALRGRDSRRSAAATSEALVQAGATGWAVGARDLDRPARTDASGELVVRVRTVEAVRNRINEIGTGEPFTSTQFNALGTRAAVDQTLSRFVKQGEIARIARGLFVRPKKSPYVGEVMPEPSKVAQAIARTPGETIQIQGAEAARLLGLTTQMPLRAVFYTSGPTRTLKLGNLQLTLKHVAQRELVLAGRPAGLAFSALWYLGKEQVGPDTIKTIREKLTPEAFEEFTAEKPAMPAWMTAALHRYEQEVARG